MTPEPPPGSFEPGNVKAQADRTKRVTAAGWTAGVSAFFLVGALSMHADWPMTVGVIAIAAMVGTACFFMLREP